MYAFTCTMTLLHICSPRYANWLQPHPRATCVSIACICVRECLHATSFLLCMVVKGTHANLPEWNQSHSGTPLEESTRHILSKISDTARWYRACARSAHTYPPHRQGSFSRRGMLLFGRFFPAEPAPVLSRLPLAFNMASSET